jgi:hypothetical protein
MKIKNIYDSIIERTNLWNYYNKDIIAPVITDTDDCYRFITQYINYSEKSKTVLVGALRIIKERSPQRLSHIVSTFFFGLWFFHHKRTKYIHNHIVEELKSLRCFQNDYDDIVKQFTFVWFMATLFHDLGYPAEEKANGTSLPRNDVPFVGSVPDYYRHIYKNYYNYRKNSEHGIYAGLIFDRDICEIRRFQEYSDSDLGWKKELEELYHYVAWIIMSHNIWLKRDNNNDIDEYKRNHLDPLILSSSRTSDNRYVDYRVVFDEYPLFSFFCIIDTIEPLKTSSCLSEIDIDLQKGRIIVKSNDSGYCEKVLGLNEWLVPTIKNEDEITLYLD